VVICAYTAERWASLMASIESVLVQTRSADELVVVIDHNEELQQDLERAAKTLRGVRIIANTYERGLAGARNCGFEATVSDVVAFLDDDAQADPGWLQAMFAAYDDPHVLGVGGALDPIWLSGRPRWFPEPFLWVVGCSYPGLPERRSPVRNVMGANMSFRRSVFERAGGFHAEFARVGGRPFGVEETELCLRSQRLFPDGYFVHEPAARAQHQVPSSKLRPGYCARLCWNEGYAKAVVSRRHGRQQGLAAERAYLRTILPHAFAAEVRAALGGDGSSPPAAGWSPERSLTRDPALGPSRPAAWRRWMSRTLRRACRTWPRAPAMERDRSTFSSAPRTVRSEP
jgi:glycosyltransferase involved in cell wall biosynthesis